MEKKRKLVSITDKEKCLDLYRQGANNSEIFRQTGIERRKVSGIIREMEKEARLREIGNARRDVAAEFLKDHIADLESASFYLTGIMSPSYWVSDLSVMPTNIKQLLYTYLKNSSFKPEAFKTYGLPENAFGTIPKNDPFMIKQIVNPVLAGKLAIEIIVALNEHLPEIWPLVNKWEKFAEEYNLATSEILPFIKAFAVGVTENSTLLEAGIGCSILLISAEDPDNEDESLLPNSSYKKETKEYIAQKIIESRQMRQQLKKSRPSLLELNNTYEKIVAMLSRSELNKKLIIGHCRYCPVP
jgi:hypothetical protein